MRRTILIVDSVDKKREDIKELFQEEYTVLEAKSGDQAISYIENFRTHLNLVIMNFVLQKGHGLEVVQFMKEEGYLATIPVVMIADDNREDEINKALDLGVSEFIRRPFHKSVVVRRCETVMGINIDKRDTEDEVKKYNSKLIERYNELEDKYLDAINNNRFIVDSLSSAVEFRNLSNGVHVKRIRKITKILMERIMELYPKYGLSQKDVDMIVEASALHDIGKVCVSDAILFKPGKLTKEEYEEMKKHTVYACSLIEPFEQKGSKFYRYCYDICRYHHERVDGDGYPDNLVGDEIPIWAQAVSIADVFDALVSQRVYKEAYEVNLAISLIYSGKCGKFSEEIMSAFESREQQIFATIDYE
ncbi:MAG: response regulator [Lachnospiraceae bacterium]|nr:response regulator [Lachnospiraceae bacterium]